MGREGKGCFEGRGIVDQGSMCGLENRGLKAVLEFWSRVCLFLISVSKSISFNIFMTSN